MRRRTVLSALASFSATAARAQTGESPKRLGFMTALSGNDPEWRTCVDVIRGQLTELGWTEGANIQFDFQTGATADHADSLAAELLKTNPDVIVARGTLVIHALQRATAAVPIVFVQVADPIRDQIVSNLARPGGNITGFSNVEGSIASKLLQFLKWCVPGIRRVATMSNPDSSPFRLFNEAVEAAAGSLSLEVVASPVHSVDEIERVIAATAATPNGGLVVLPDSFPVVNRKTIIEAAARHRLPAIYPYRIFAVEGGLLSYGIDTYDSFRRAAGYVDRILRGVRPGELPIQFPTKFEMVVNLKTARSLGLEVPETLTQLADEVIE